MISKLLGLQSSSVPERTILIGGTEDKESIEHLGFWESGPVLSEWSLLKLLTSASLW